MRASAPLPGARAARGMLQAAPSRTRRQHTSIASLQCACSKDLLVCLDKLAWNANMVWRCEICCSRYSGKNS